MNRSSLISNQDNISSFLNESGLSTKKCCEYRQKYEEIYREMSQTRIESRNLKQENAVLRNTLKGLQEENSVLKNILTNKKEIINKLNYEIRSSNLEVNRLEDQLNCRNEKDAAIQEEIKRTVAITKELEENWRRSKDDYKTLMGKYERVNEDRERLKEEHAREVTRLREEKRTEIQRNNQVFNEKIEQLTYSIQSPSKTSKQGTMRGYSLKENKISSPSTTLKHLDINIHNFKQKWENQEVHYQQVLQSKDRQIKELSNKINELQSQTAESMELFEDQIKEMETLKVRLKASENEKLQQAQTTKSKHTEREQLLSNVNKRLAALLKNSLFCDNIQVIDKLLSILPQNPKKFQTEIIMKEIQASFQANYNNSLKNAVTSQQYEKLSRSFAELQESNDLLQLKYNTLSREYSEVLDDNNRLIKYNNLTRFRVDRNLSGKCDEKVRMDRTPYLTRKGLREEESSNKENLRSTINQ